MRVVFMGTPEFAVPSLRALAARHDVVGVYSRPDAASGRGSSLRPSPVKLAALELGLPVLQPATLRDPEAQAALADLSPDLVVVAAYGLILPKAVLEIPRLGCVNVHASLLPRWRGAAPIQRAILAGDSLTGVAIMRMEEGLDTGAYCAVATVAVDDLTTTQLTAALAQAGAETLVEALPRLEAGTCDWVEQDESRVTYAAKIEKHEVVLDPSLTVDEALRRVRASSAQAPSRLLIADKGVQAISASASDHLLEPGSVACTKRSLLLGMADGTVSLDRIKPDGKAEMAGCDWARGLRLDDTTTWKAAL